MTDQLITPFLFEGEALVRVVTRDGEPWFVAADVCWVLKHSNPTVAVERLDDDEKGVSSVYTPGGDQQMIIINESGLYALILTSRKPQAKRFRKWVTADVLPSIRKTGGYSREPRSQVLPPISDQVQDVALNLRIVTETRQSFGCKASQQMWFKLNLPTVPAMFEPGGQMALPFTHAAE